MKLDFRSLANSSVRKLTPYQPGKPIEELERELGISSAIKLASNENPLGASAKAIQAAKKSLAKAHIYPDGSYFELKQTLAKFLAKTPEQITVGNGSENLLELIIKTYLLKDDTAVISQYAFMAIPLLIRSYDAQAKVVAAHDFGHDIAGMIKAVDKKTRLVFLVNPNNPTGTYTTDRDFCTLMESVPPHVLVVVDEAYAEYMNIEDYPNTLRYLETYPNLIITRTFSKAYGLAALRIGYAISSPEIADMLNRARLPFNVNAVAVNAAIAALADQEHLQKSVQLGQQGLQVLKTGLQKLELNTIPSVGNFITVDVGNGEKVYQKLLYKGVIVRPLSAYDMPNHIRVTVGTAEQNERFLTTLQEVLFSLSSADKISSKVAV